MWNLHTGRVKTCHKHQAKFPCFSCPAHYLASSLHSLPPIPIHPLRSLKGCVTGALNWTQRKSHKICFSHVGNLTCLPLKAIPGCYKSVHVQDNKGSFYEICRHSIYQVGHEQSLDNTKDLYLFSREGPSKCQKQGR